MLQIYPENTSTILGFDKIKELLLSKCRSDEGKQNVAKIKFNTKADVIQLLLNQVSEYIEIIKSGNTFPNNFTHNIHQELKLLKIQGASLNGEQLLYIKNLTNNIKVILSWFKAHNKSYPTLQSLSEPIVYQNQIVDLIQSVIDELGIVRDNASKELFQIKTELSTLRNQLRKTFESFQRKYNKLGYLADISEGYLNGRRTLAILSEYKRVVRGVIHGESDSQKITFIEPEETISLNNEIFSLESLEKKEIQKIFSQTTRAISVYHTDLLAYYKICGVYEFINAKAQLAIELNAQIPKLSLHSELNIYNAKHPLLLISNNKNNKSTIPLNLKLDKSNRILIISGPNAGGKTVSMKTIGLLQLMIQAGLAVPLDADSTIGIFKQLMIHIGDAQSIEQELSTYSAHLKDMKYFIDFSGGKTLFLIDELGSGSDPLLGGVFAEAIVEELHKKHAIGIITTHYLNLKVMADKINGIINGSMLFDEKELAPLYQLHIGKPGSSYTFAIAQRIGIQEKIISRAKQLAEKGQLKLDQLLLKTEQKLLSIKDKEIKLSQLIKENDILKKEFERLNNKEKFKQEQAIIKLQNTIKLEELTYLQEMERNIKQIITEWKKSENKAEVIKSAEEILFKKKQIQSNKKAAHKANKNYETVGSTPQKGDTVRHKQNHQIGTIIKLKANNATIQINKLPFNVNIDEWVVVKKKVN